MATLEIAPKSELIERFVVPWLEMAWPIRWEECFGRPGGIELEIGFGNGSFLVEKAKQRPETHFIGIEVSWRSIKRLLRRLNHEEVENIRVLQGDAKAAVSRLFTAESISEVYINFPDPWPKAKTYRRRLVQTEFLGLLAEKLISNGRVTLATDHAEYAAWMVGVLEHQPWFVSCFPSTSVHELPGRAPTKYESKALAQGARIHYFVWRKQSDVTGPVTSEQVQEMPNVVLKSESVRGGFFRDFSPQEWAEINLGEKVIIKLLRAYQESGQSSELLEALVIEGPLSQDFGILVMVRDNGRVVIRPADMGFPRPTWGVKRAVWHTANLLLHRHPDMKVSKTTVGEFDLPDQGEPSLIHSQSPPGAFPKNR